MSKGSQAPSLMFIREARRALKEGKSRVALGRMIS
jgi:hypothetical protein